LNMGIGPSTDGKIIFLGICEICRDQCNQTPS
jgi:hypothetical protein